MIALFALLSVADAGAWTRSLGEYYGKVGVDLYVASNYVVPGGGDAATRGYLGQQYGVYAELGLTEAHPVQLAVSAPLTIGSVDFVREDAFQITRGHVTSIRMGDLRLRPQVALHPDRPLAFAVEVKLPLYSVDRICTDYGPYRDVCPRPGYGQIDVTEWLLAGASIPSSTLWAEVGIGYEHRTEVFLGWSTDLALADGLVWATTAGGSVGPLLVMAKADGAHPLRSDGITPGWVRVGPSLLYTVSEGIGLEARAQWDLVTQVSSRGMGFGAGVSVRR